MTVVSSAAVFAAPVRAQDTLADILLPGENWQLAAEGFKFTDGPAVDANGVLYFADVPNNKIFRLKADGQAELFVANSDAVNGMAFGPDGRLYACQPDKKRIVAYDSHGHEREVFRGEFIPNDLIVRSDGSIYFTDSEKKTVWCISPSGEGRRADRGIGRPNGIALWPKQGTLVISDTLSAYLWTFRIDAEGGLVNKERFYEMETPADRAASGADGMTADSQGRLYVATYLGIQVFDTQGRLTGVIGRPSTAFMSNLKFAGPQLDTLYVTSTDKIYRRKLKATGVRYFDPPAANAK
ncbi:MAG TPA: SMP-30/gluconolactonase/LRE family protein [Pirellulales bacterium]